jgi:hypothetical protein
MIGKGWLRKMSSDELLEQLHDRATRGETLAPEDQERLESWYAHQDAAEAERIGASTASPSLVALHEQIDSALTRLTAVTRRVQTVSAENEALRREIVILRHRLVHLLTPQSV